MKHETKYALAGAYERMKELTTELREDIDSRSDENDVDGTIQSDDLHCQSLQDSLNDIKGTLTGMGVDL